jgi:hypothetical protein
VAIVVAPPTPMDSAAAFADTVPPPTLAPDLGPLNAGAEAQETETRIPERLAGAWRKVPRRAQLLVGVIPALVLIVGVQQCMSRKRSESPATVAAPAGSTSSVTVSSGAPPPESAAPPDVVASSAPAKAATKPRPRTNSFDHAAAAGSISAIGHKLGACGVPKGNSVKLRITFAKEGTVSSVAPVSPRAGSQAQCVVALAKTAKVSRFEGPAPADVYTVASR